MFINCKDVLFGVVWKLDVMCYDKHYIEWLVNLFIGVCLFEEESVD